MASLIRRTDAIRVIDGLHLQEELFDECQRKGRYLMMMDFAYAVNRIKNILKESIMELPEAEVLTIKFKEDRE